MLGSRPLSDSEIDSLLQKLESSRDKCLFILGLRTGFRISELLSISINDLKEHNGTLKSHITVVRSKMKGKKSSRVVPISKNTIELLQTYINTLPKSQTYLFESQKGGLMSRIHAWRIIKSASIRANLTGRIGTHSSRKSYAKRIYEASGRDLVRTQKALGHSSVNSTISYLNSFSNEEIDQLILDSENNN